MSDGTSDLPLFHGPHIPRIRFEQALDRLDLRAAVEAAPEPWQAAVETLAVVLDQAGTPARFEPVRGAVRCGFHGGPLLEAAGDLIDRVREDAMRPVERWLLPYAWFAHHIDLDELRNALDAENLLARPPLVLPGDARAFAWYLLDAGGRRYVGQSVGVIEARKRLRQISPAAFRRYLVRV